jgi:uncharacterized protein (DUF433 family)
MPSLAADPVPIRIDDDGTYRVGGTRVTLDVVIDHHFAGKTPEQIVASFPSLKLADVYSVISYALNHSQELDAYLQEREREASVLRQQLVESGMTPKDTMTLRAKLQDRMKARNQQARPQSNGPALGG